MHEIFVQEQQACDLWSSILNVSWSLCCIFSREMLLFARSQSSNFIVGMWPRDALFNGILSCIPRFTILPLSFIDHLPDHRFRDDIWNDPTICLGIFGTSLTASVRLDATVFSVDLILSPRSCISFGNVVTTGLTLKASKLDGSIPMGYCYNLRLKMSQFVWWMTIGDL